MTAQHYLPFDRVILLQGVFVKAIGNGLGKSTKDTYVLQDGMFTKMAGASGNAAGDTKQGTVTYTIKFALVKRAIL
jgi:hypothetical protein